jgi:hypothetical protein
VKTRILLGALVAGLAVLLALQLRRSSPARHVEGLSYAVACLNCKTNYTMTTSEMNAMIARGDVVSPPEEVRRFKCRGCGELQATLDLSGYLDLIKQKEAAP